MPIPGPTPGLSGTVLLDDGTGTFPYDVSAYVRQSAPITRTRGRGDELSQNQPGQLTLTFDNTDGRFTVGNVTYNVACDQRIRVVWFYGTPSATTRFTGAVQSWPVSWPTGDDTLAEVTAIAVDPLAALARSELRSSLVEEMMLDAPAAAWTCGEATGSTQAVDLTGVAPALTVGTSTTGAPDPVWGGDLHAPDGATGVKFSPDPLNVSSGSLTCVYARTVTSLHAQLVFTCASSMQADDMLVFSGPSGPFIIGATNTGGGVIRLGINPGDGSTFNPTQNVAGGEHIVSVESSAVDTRIFLDGVLVNVGPAIVGTWNFGTVTVGRNYRDSASTLVIGMVEIGTRVTDTRVLANHLAALSDCRGETVAQRLARIGGYVSATVGALSTTGSTTLGPVAQAGRNALDVIQESADADLGSAYVDGVGALRYISGSDLAAKVTADMTIGAVWADESTAFPVDMTSVVNYATGKASSSGVTYLVTDPVSIAGDVTHRAHGRYSADYSWNVASDAQALGRTQWKVNVYSQPLPRCPTLKIDLLSLDDIALRNQVLALDLGSYVQVTGLPAQTPGGTTAQLIVEGMQETYQAGGGSAEWSLEINCAQRSLWDAFIADDAVRGIPDSASARVFI